MSLRMMLLSELVIEPKTGYDLANDTVEWSNVWKASASQIYTELRAMEVDGLVVAGEPGVRNRRVYEVSEAGRTALVAWLTETPTDHSQRNETIVRAFGLGLLGPEEALDWLDGEIRFHEERYKQLSAEIDSIDADTDPSQRGHVIGLTAGAFRTHAAVDWAIWARRQIERWAELDATSGRRSRRRGDVE